MRLAVVWLACAAALAGQSPAPSVASRDPSLTVGTLPNGLRYYLRPNLMPAHRVELRLVVDAGSVLEDDDQRGFAHFLEHMAFDGTTHFPGHTLIDFIETSGMRYGADLNAMTTPDETIYTLTLPSDDRQIIERGLDVLQDWAGGGIIIDSAAVVAERGIVMGEWRTRLPDSAERTVRAHYDTVYLGTSRYVSRTPIGDTALIKTATAEPIRRFYRDWYRPDRMTLVVVGDIDPSAMEREIRRRFGAIRAQASARPRPAVDLPSHRAPFIDVYRGNVAPGLELEWPAPVTPPRVRDAVRRQLVHDIILASAEQRLLSIRAHPSRAFVTTELEQGRLVRPIAIEAVDVITWPDSLERGFATVLAEVERIAQHGVPSAVLAHEKTVLLGQFQHAASGEGGRSSKAYADAYVDHVLTGEGSLLDAQRELAYAREILPHVTRDDLARAARDWLDPSGLRILFRVPLLAHVRPPTEESVLAIIDSISRTPLAADSDHPFFAGPLFETPPIPGRIISEQSDRVAGITEWTLSNGARVILKPTHNDPDDVQIRAWSPGGFCAMPDSLFLTPGRMVAHVMTDVGGLGSTTHDALGRRFAANGLRQMQVSIGYADQSIRVAGSPKELEMLFQVLHLQFTAPFVDTAALAGWKSLAKYQAPAVSLDDQINQEMAMGDPRLLPVSTNIAELATVKDLMAAYWNRFGDAGSFTFTIVGAVSPGDVRPLVERYLASLPGPAKIEQPKLAREHVAYLNRVSKTLRALEPPKATTLLVFDGLFPPAPRDYLRERQRLSALTYVLDNRIRTRLRQELSGTYSPFVSSETYALPEERYRVALEFDAAPERIGELNVAMMRVVDSLRSNGVSAAEAARAATVQRRQLETRLEDDNYWMATIGTYIRLGIPLDAIPAPYGDHTVTPDEVQAAARRYMPEDAYFHLTLVPRDSTS
jgi:zinc protease